jgi:hypothetical protein
MLINDAIYDAMTMIDGRGSLPHSRLSDAAQVNLRSRIGSNQQIHPISRTNCGRICRVCRIQWNRMAIAPVFSVVPVLV